MAAPLRRVFVVGVGMTKFEKPGRRDDFDYPQMALEAGTKALEDAGLRYEQIEQACCGYVYGDTCCGQRALYQLGLTGIPVYNVNNACSTGDTCCGQRALYQLGLTGIPVYNVNNACSTGSTALFMARNLIAGGMADCVMALGFEKMEKGSLTSKYTDRTIPQDKHVETMLAMHDIGQAPLTPQMFGNAGRDHMKKYGTKPEHFAKIAWKNHKHSINNPYSQFQDEYTLDQIQNSPMVYFPLTKLQCCPTSDGAGCAILASESFVRKNGLEAQAVEIVAMEMGTDEPAVFSGENCMQVVGYDMAKTTAERAFKKAGMTPDDVQVVELHDCFSANELVTYEALGLCPEGKAGEFIDRGDNTYGGKYVINPSGGLISKGHPLGATGLAQCSELTWQLRGLAQKRQVPGVKACLQHNLGLGGAVVITLYKLGFPEAARGRQLVAQPTSSVSTPGFKCSQIFVEMQKKLEQDGANIVNKVKGVFLFKVKGSDGKEATWTVDVKNGSGSVKLNSKDVADTTIIMSDEDLCNLMLGKLNPQTAFLQGKLKITGNMGLAMKLKEIQPKGGSKFLILTEVESRLYKMPQIRANLTSSSVEAPGYKSSEMFKQIQDALSQDGANIVKKMKGVFCFKVKGTDGKIVSWTVDVKNGNGAVKINSKDKADTTITMADQDLYNLMLGKLNPQTKRPTGYT
ncbi:non-specific lipid-transfer protein-like [Plakobranchus ocellatus]|uniref:Sterol carrier protein 2 n=1 Tax=Plakobranchus ocellatus TaxID=259542 RepID=A0AAV4BHN8_9GAST|nr:non-specific lipid-transfer protein-like [Plakobranchus ocellatus]